MDVISELIFQRVQYQLERSAFVVAAQIFNVLKQESLWSATFQNTNYLEKQSSLSRMLKTVLVSKGIVL